MSSGEATATDDGGAVAEVVGGIAQAEEFAIPLVAVVAVAALLFSSLWVVYSAPLLFAELLVDGVLSATLYRRLRGIETRHWLETAVRRTVVPFVVTVVAAGLCGMTLQYFHPAASSLGAVLHSTRSGG
jgi:hypothetical protein